MGNTPSSRVKKEGRVTFFCWAIRSDWQRNAHDHAVVHDRRAVDFLFDQGPGRLEDVGVRV